MKGLGWQVLAVLIYMQSNFWTTLQNGNSAHLEKWYLLNRRNCMAAGKHTKHCSLESVKAFNQNQEVQGIFTEVLQCFWDWNIGVNPFSTYAEAHCHLRVWDCHFTWNTPNFHHVSYPEVSAQSLWCISFSTLPFPPCFYHVPLDWS